jgi:hypothetical protein
MYFISLSSVGFCSICILQSTTQVIDGIANWHPYKKILDYFLESEKSVKQYSNSMPITSIKFDMTITLLKDKSPVCKKKVYGPLIFCLDTEASIFGATVPEAFIDFKQHLQNVKLAEEKV